MMTATSTPGGGMKKSTKSQAMRSSDHIESMTLSMRENIRKRSQLHLLSRAFEVLSQG